MAKNTIHRYDIVDKDTKEVILSDLHTREWAREEKQFFKEFEERNVVIQQRTYVLDTQRDIR